jgi:tetratricopeptide (TPR) repeat protein
MKRLFWHLFIIWAVLPLGVLAQDNKATETPVGSKEPDVAYKNFKDAYAAGNQALKDKKWGDAFAAYKAAEDLATSDIGKAQADNAQGWVLLKEKKWKEAKEILSKAAEADPDNKTVQKNLGVACYRMYEYGFAGVPVLREAIKDLEISDDTEFLDMAKGAQTREDSYTQMTPEPEPNLDGLNFKALTALGDKVQSKGQFDLALKIFKKAEDVAVSPGAKGAAANRQGKVLIDARRPNESIPYFERAVKYQPNEKVFLNNLGFSYWVLYDSGKGTVSDLKKAADVFYKGNAVDPSYHVDNLKMAVEELKEVDPESAKAYTIKEDKGDGAGAEDDNTVKKEDSGTKTDQDTK